MNSRFCNTLILLLLKNPVDSWTLSTPPRHHQSKNTPSTITASTSSSSTRLQSTPFEADYYDDSNNPFMGEESSLAQPADTKLVLGINKYSHDTSLCAANAETGEVLFAMAKERLTRKKNDSGNVASLVETCLECLDLDFDCIQKVVMNNHHHRILPLEANRAHMEWESGLGINGGAEGGYDDEENLLGDAEKVGTFTCYFI
jgi:phosphoribosyl-AMP cyclohydrolase